VASANDGSVKNESRDERQAVKDAHALIVQKNPTGCKFALSHAGKKLFFYLQAASNE
jgi:hypothetical protein